MELTPKAVALHLHHFHYSKKSYLDAETKEDMCKPGILPWLS